MAEKRGWSGRWKDKRFYVPVLACGMIAAVIAGTGPYMVMSALGLYHSVFMVPFGIMGIVIGVIVAVFCAVTLGAKLEDDA